MQLKLALLITLLLMLLDSAGLGQPIYQLNNYNVRAPVFDAEGTPLYGTNYRAELWGGAASNSLSPAILYYSNQRFTAPFTLAPGYAVRSATPDELTVSSYVFLPDAPPWNWAWLELRAWDVRLGSTYEEVEALGIGGYGKSQPFFAPGGDAGHVFLPNPPWPLTGLKSFSLLPVVPEPSTFVLLGLGTLMCFTARHSRKKLKRLA